MAAIAGIAYQLLYPLQVNDRYYADQQIDVLSHVVVFGDHAAVQALLEQHVGRCRKWLPGCESAGYLNGRAWRRHRCAGTCVRLRCCFYHI